MDDTTTNIVFVTEDELTDVYTELHIKINAQNTKILIGLGLGASGLAVGLFAITAIGKMGKTLGPIMQLLNSMQVAPAESPGTYTAVREEPIDETKVVPKGSVVAEPQVKGAPLDLNLNSEIDPTVEAMRNLEDGL